MDGASDVGVTYRPKVTFSRPVDPATFTSSSFYATDGTYATDASATKVAANILPTADNTAAYLLFTNPLPGASTITLHVLGEKIKGADGALLDAAGMLSGPGSTTKPVIVELGTAAVLTVVKVSVRSLPDVPASNSTLTSPVGTLARVKLPCVSVKTAWSSWPSRRSGS
jgi:hypothetical protein